ncbi:leukocyte tyrosine kinase receptor-like isoform X2 [Gigantopelta aegis]|uniref:leukocyte tyrosine kinase receptor-like isoform X2 n=1 Tax=Gigantopelta aegis TaxID=1735272 RepID=UPI001B8885AB|nr:leukocyte tyrosine kinase receptor-like isoform X2 [Gigantopelta aegis]
MRIYLDFGHTREFFLWIVIVFWTQSGTAIYRCDFETAGCQCPWLTADNSGFSLATTGVYTNPVIDASGNKSGHFVEVKGSKGNKSETFMHSQCFESRSASCTLKLSYMINGPSPAQKFDPSTLTVKFVAGCQHNIEGLVEVVPMKVFYGNLSERERWKTVNVTIGNRTDTFRVILTGYTPSMSSFVAVDNLEFFNCEPDRPDDGSCMADEFQCSSSRCISRDHVCNIEHDCSCDEDERLLECEQIPYYGRCTFENCDFESADCGWYNVQDDDFDWLLQNYTHPFFGKQDHTRDDGRGHFVSINNTRTLAIDSTAVLRSVQLPPPPKSGLCSVRFFIHLKHGSLEVDVVAQEVKGHHRKRVLWQSSKDLRKDYRWQFIAVPVRNITQSYVLEFRAYKAKGNNVGVFLDDISLSLECITFPEKTGFTTCGAKGRLGPTPAQCEAAYTGTNSENVSVEEKGRYSGAQIWIVPESTTYSITASGGCGGIGTSSQSEAVGGYVHAKFDLQKGDKIYIVVGHQGESTRCDKQNKVLSDDCNILLGKHGTNKTSQNVGGGGAGGGATYVFMVNENGEPDILLVAGGGGGLGAAFRGTDISAVGGIEFEGDGKSGWTTLNSPSAGGGAGWKGRSKSPQTGRSLLEGGDAPKSNNATLNGQGGTSYANPSAKEVLMDSGHTLERDGFVQILPQRGCQCVDICIWIDYRANQYSCRCFNPNNEVGENGEDCILRKEKSGMIIAIVTSAVIFALLLAGVGACLCGSKFFNFKKCHPGTISLDKIVSYCQPKHMHSSQRVRQATQSSASVMVFNPNYDYVSAKHLDHNLVQVPRKHIKLTRPLGRGAFGEVCEGTMGSPNSSVPKVRIAVKTLLPLCTEQTEIDFLMEAIIVSRFSHPNIVNFLGVCFEQRPKLIILELLEGGDLRSFLRESRPKPGEPSTLTVADLLRLALDVARGCQHLEDKHFIHRDIAARNCLLTTKDVNRVAKIADFGLARDIYRSDYYKKSGNAWLPVKWMPPEAFLDGIFTSKTDTWSFGVLLWEVFSLGYMPYPGCTNEEVVHFVTAGGRLDAPVSCPSSVYDIMASCWSGIAEERPPFSLIVSTLDNCLQDQDLSSNLPIIYLPVMHAARSFKVPQSMKSSASGDGAKRQSDGCLEPLLPLWLTEDQAEGGPVNDEDSSEDEDMHLQRSKYEKDVSEYDTKRDSPRKSSSVQLHIPPSELPLLTVEDFQELFENEHHKKSEASSRS